MLRRTILASALFAALVGPSLAEEAKTSEQAVPPTAAQIVDKNIAARGGLAAWREVQALQMSGLMDAGHPRPPMNPALLGRKETKASIRAAALEREKRSGQEQKAFQLPFTMDLARNHKMRVEVVFQGQTAVQVYDGSQGWKVRPYLGRTEAEPYSPAEAKMAAEQHELDGPLIDYAAKGTKVELAGTDKVDGRDTYKLTLTLKDGQVRHVWIDAATFLEAKEEGAPRRLDGRERTVATYYSDFRQVGKLKIPHMLETRVDGVRDSEKIRIDKVAVNPAFDDKLFQKPL